MPLASTSRELADATAVLCRHIAGRLARRGEHVDHVLQTLRILSMLVGVVAFLAASVPDVKNNVPQAWQSWITVIAAVTLVVGSLAYMVIGKNPPERFRDYARYIEGYASRLEEIIADEALQADVKNLRIMEVTRMANVNLQDVRSLWPWAFPKERV